MDNQIIETLTNHPIAEEVYIDTKEAWWVYSEAISELTNQTTLIKIAKNDKIYGRVRQAAAAKLNDNIIAQEVYADIVKNDTENGFLALANLNDQTALIDIAKDKKISGLLRLIAAEKQTDLVFAQKVYADIAKNEESSYVSSSAFEKITDQKIKQEILAIKCMHKFSYGELYDPKDSGMYWRKATCDICGFVEEQLVGCE